MENECRLCLRKSSDECILMNVFLFNDDHQIADVIQTICSIIIYQDEAYSKEVCAECLGIIFKANDLRKTAIKNDQCLKKQDPSYRLIVKIEDPDDLIKFEPVLNSEAEEDIGDFSESESNTYQPTLPTCYIVEPNESYQCDRCPRTVKSKQEMENHLSKHFSNQVNFKQLILRKHTLDCNNCDLSFKSQIKYDRHLKIHSFFAVGAGDGSALQCQYCTKQFDKDSLEKIYEHIKYHEKQSWRNKDKRKKSSTKRIREEYESSLVCPHCGQIYRTKQILQQHIKRHFDTGDKYACQNCSKKFKSWGELYYHNAVHTTERNFICEICSKAFKAKRDLRNHKIRHLTKDVKKFQCTYCQLFLKNKYTLNRHILIHTGEKPHSCQYCQKAFTQKNELNKHLRTHIGENTYKCDDQGCTEAFRLLADLRLHQQVHWMAQKGV